MKAFQYLAGAASIVLAYYALKDRGFFGDASKPVGSTVPETDPDPDDYWGDHNRWRIF